MGLCGSKLAKNQDAQDMRVPGKNGARNTNGQRSNGRTDETGGDKDNGRNAAEYNEIVSQAIKDLAGDVHDDEVTQAIGSAIVMVSHNGTQEQRKLLVEQALGNMMEVFNSSTNYLTRESVIRGISQLARCSRTDEHRLGAVQNPEVLKFALDALELHQSREVTSIVMHACDLLRYVIVSDEDRAAAIQGGAINLLESIIDFSTDLSPDNDVVKSAFQVLLALGPCGQNDVLITVSNALIRHFFYASVITPALACLMSITVDTDAALRFQELSLGQFIDKAKEVHKENNNVRAYVNRIHSNIAYHAKQRQATGGAVPSPQNVTVPVKATVKSDEQVNCIQGEDANVASTREANEKQGSAGAALSTVRNDECSPIPVSSGNLPFSQGTAMAGSPTMNADTGADVGLNEISATDNSAPLRSRIPSNFMSTSQMDAEPRTAPDGNSSQEPEFSGRRDFIASNEDGPEALIAEDMENENENANANASPQGVNTEDINLQSDLFDEKR